MNTSSIHLLGSCAAVLLSGVLCGCVDPSMIQGRDKPATEAVGVAPMDDAAPAGEPEAEAPAAVPVRRNPAAAFTQTGWKLVDKKKALAKNPNLIEAENKISTGDPLLAATQSYFALGSKAQLSALKHNIDIHHAQWEKYPTYEEFETLLKQSGADLKGLYPWQAYAYDETTGDLTILEDPEFKKKLYEEAGLPLPE